MLLDIDKQAKFIVPFLNSTYNVSYWLIEVNNNKVLHHLELHNKVCHVCRYANAIPLIIEIKLMIIPI